MTKDEAKYQATAAAQLIMAKYIAIQADGKWGRFTQSAFEQMSPDVQAEIRQTVLRMSGMSVSDLFAARVQQKSKAKTTVADRSNIRALIEKIAGEEGVPVMTALKIAFLESRFDPGAISPTGAKGVYQFTGIAIRDLAQRADFVLSNPFDAEQNIRGGMKFIKLMARDIKSALDDTAKVYMAFNIGPSGARAVLTGKADSVAGLINKQAYGAPAVYQARLTQAVQNALA